MLLAINMYRNKQNKPIAKIGLCNKPRCPNNLEIIIDNNFTFEPSFEVFVSISGNKLPNITAPVPNADTNKPVLPDIIAEVPRHNPPTVPQIK